MAGNTLKQYPCYYLAQVSKNTKALVSKISNTMGSLKIQSPVTVFACLKNSRSRRYTLYNPAPIKYLLLSHSLRHFCSRL